MLFAAFATAGKDWYTLEKAFGYVEGVAQSLSSLDAGVLSLGRQISVFLILGNVINFVGQTTPLLFAAFAPAGKDWYTYLREGL